MISFRFLIFSFVLINLVTSFSKLDCKCRLKISKKIVGGHQVAKNDYVPWQAVLFYMGTFICGAFILNENHIITASHCAPKFFNTKSLVAVVGVSSLKGIDSNLIYGIQSIIIHPLYNSSALQNGHDISILKLNRTIKFKLNYIEPACLKYQKSILKEPFNNIMVSGFGGTTPVYVKNGLRTSLTPSVDLKYAFFKEYENHYSKQLISVRSIQNGDSTCSGDSGSPTMITQNGKTYVIGLNSFGLIKNENSMDVRCYGESGFCRLSFESNFIEKHVNKKDFCLF